MVFFEANHPGGIAIEVPLTGVEEHGIGMNHIAFWAWRANIAELIPVLSTERGEFAIQRLQARVAELLETWRILVVFVLVTGRGAVDSAQGLQGALFIGHDALPKVIGNGDTHKH